MITERLTRIIEQELKLADLNLQDTTLATEVPGWDSLKHLSIIAAVEHEYGIRFRSLEVLKLKNIGELQALINRKLPSDQIG